MENLEQRLKELHKDIILDICMNVNNCANCHNDETRQIDCYPLQCVEMYEVSEKSFCIEPYCERTNKLLFNIADRYGYKSKFIMEGKEIALIKFWKQ